MRKRVLPGVLLPALAALALLFPAAAPAGPLTLQGAREEALRVALKIRSARERTAGAGLAREEKFTAFLPTFSVEGFASSARNRGTVVVPGGTYGTFPFGGIPSTDAEIETGQRELYSVSLKVEQPLFRGGRIRYAYERAREEEKYWGHEEEETVQATLYQVEEGYLTLLKAIEVKAVEEQNVRTLDAHLAATDQRFQKGRVALNDVLKVRVAVAEAKEKRVRADHDVLIARGRLNLLLDRPYDAPVDLAPLPEIEPLGIAAGEAEALAMENRPSLKKYRVQKEAAYYDRRVAESGYFPNLNLTGEYNRRNRQPGFPEENLIAALKLDWAVWQWGGTDFQVDAARVQERRIGHDIADLANRIKGEVREARLKIEAADYRIGVAEEAVRFSRENLRITKFGFENGGKTSTEVLDAENLYQKAGAEYVNAKHDAHMARLDFRLAVGRMLDERLPRGAGGT